MKPECPNSYDRLKFKLGEVLIHLGLLKISDMFEQQEVCALCHNLMASKLGDSQPIGSQIHMINKGLDIRDLIHMGLQKFFYALKELEQKIFHKESYAFNATQKHDSKVGGYKIILVKSLNT